MLCLLLSNLLVVLHGVLEPHWALKAHPTFVFLNRDARESEEEKGL